MILNLYFNCFVMWRMLCLEKSLTYWHSRKSKLVSHSLISSLDSPAPLDQPYSVLSFWSLLGNVYLFVSNVASVAGLPSQKRLSSKPVQQHQGLADDTPARLMSGFNQTLLPLVHHLLPHRLLSLPLKKDLLTMEPLMMSITEST